MKQDEPTLESLTAKIDRHRQYAEECHSKKDHAGFHHHTAVADEANEKLAELVKHLAFT